jgi:hypothetical protein
VEVWPPEQHLRYWLHCFAWADLHLLMFDYFGILVIQLEFSLWAQFYFFYFVGTFFIVFMIYIVTMLMLVLFTPEVV